MHLRKKVHLSVSHARRLDLQARALEEEHLAETSLILESNPLTVACLTNDFLALNTTHALRGRRRVAAPVPLIP